MSTFNQQRLYSLDSNKKVIEIFAGLLLKWLILSAQVSIQMF